MAKLKRPKKAQTHADPGPLCARAVTEQDLQVHPVLKNYFGYCLYKAAMRFKVAMDGKISKYGICTTQLGMLRVLIEAGEMSQNQLGTGMGIDKASMAKWIEQLERKGWVKRAEDPKDRRIKIVSPTKTGVALAEEIAQYRKEFEKEFLSRLSPEEEKVLRTAIPKLIV